MNRRARGRPRHDDLLTPAEWRVVEMLRHGMSVRAVARRLRISLDAVKFHVANATGKLGLDGLAQLRRWTGIARHSALARKAQKEKSMTTLETRTRLGAIGQIARSVSDIDAAVAWYRDVLGLPLLFTVPGGEGHSGMAFFDCGGTRLYLQAGEARGESLLYFNVPDIHAAHDALVARGADCHAVPHIVHREADGSELWMAFYRDNDAPLVAHPHGRLVALMAQVPG